MATCRRNMAGVEKTLLIKEEKKIQEMRSSNEEVNEEGTIEKKE